MKVLKLATVTDASGNLHLDIPKELLPGTVDVVIVLNLSIPENSQTKAYDFSDLAGRLSWKDDGVAMQRVLRDEW